MAEKQDLYEGPVCYQDGWHYAVESDEAGYDVPGTRLFSNGDGTYRPANDGDQSHHDQFHKKFATVELEDGAAGLRVSEDEFAAIQEMLNERRAQ